MGMSSKEGLRFALERFGDTASYSSEAIVLKIRDLLHSPSEYAVLHNLCKALGRTGDASAAPVLVEVMRTSSVPVARTASIEAMELLGNPIVVPDLIAWVGLEPELGPRQAIFSCLGSLGGAEAADFLAKVAKEWLSQNSEYSRSGQLAWTAFLSLETPSTIQKLHEMATGLPLSLRAQALLRLAQLGDFTVKEELRTFLSYQHVPSAGTRSTAVEALALLGSWDAMSFAVDDPDPMVRMAVLKGFRLPSAIAAGAGKEILYSFARSQDLNFALPALQALCERGDRVLLEPWLRIAATYPNGPQSAEAINLLRQEGVSDSRTAPFLLQRWEFCDDSAKIDLLRIFGRLQSVEALEVIQATLLDETTHPEVHLMCIVQLGNIGPEALPILLKVKERGVPDVFAESWVSALAHIAMEDPAARSVLLELALDGEEGSAIRYHVISVLPKILKSDAWPVLMEIRNDAQTTRVASYAKDLLLEYF